LQLSKPVRHYATLRERHGLKVSKKSPIFPTIHFANHNRDNADDIYIKYTTEAYSSFARLYTPVIELGHPCLTAGSSRAGVI